MKTITGLDNYAIFVNDLGELTDVIFLENGNSAITNHDDLYIKKVMVMSKVDAEKELKKPQYAAYLPTLPDSAKKAIKRIPVPIPVRV